MLGKTCQLREYHLTFDIDWAPDFAIDDIRQRLIESNCRATFFVTHPSDTIDDLIRDGHNIGIHPNFLPGSSQGKDEMTIVENLLKLCPDAVSMRTHALVQSSSLLYDIYKNFPQLKYDLSLFTYKFPYVEMFDWIYEDVKFQRINYNWEDDVAFFDRGFSWEMDEISIEKVVFDFHPIHVALNSSEMTNYKGLKSKIGSVPLHKAKRQDVASFRTDYSGANTFLSQLLRSNELSISFGQLVKPESNDVKV